MEFNTDRNTEEVENIAAAENDVGQRLDIYLAAKLEVSRSNKKCCSGPHKQRFC